MTEVIGLENVFVRFPAGHDWLGRVNSHAHALNGVSLAVERGQTLGILGESGCGKSTLAQVMTGLLPPTSGKVTGRLDTSRVSIVLQDPNSSLDPRMPVWRIVTEPVFLHSSPGKHSLRQLAASLLGRVGLRPEHMDRHPHEFSGGQRQRIAIARAMLKNPPLLLLDEATSALDAESERMVQAALESAMVGRTTLVIAHRLATVQKADHIVVLDHGRIVEQGTHADLVAQGGMYAGLAALQFNA